jgi:hypothetical protein
VRSDIAAHTLVVTCDYNGFGNTVRNTLPLMPNPLSIFGPFGTKSFVSTEALPRMLMVISVSLSVRYRQSARRNRCALLVTCGYAGFGNTVRNTLPLIPLSRFGPFGTRSFVSIEALPRMLIVISTLVD